MGIKGLGRVGAEGVRRLERLEGEMREGPLGCKKGRTKAGRVLNQGRDKEVVTVCPMVSRARRTQTMVTRQKLNNTEQTFAARFRHKVESKTSDGAEEGDFPSPSPMRIANPST